MALKGDILIMPQSYVLQLGVPAFLEETVAEFVDQMLVDRRTEYGITDETGATVGIVSLQHLKDVGQRNRATTPVADVMAEESLTVQATADAFDALVELGTTKTSYALVEEDGAIVGILSQADYASALELRRGIGTVGERDQSMPMTGAGDVSASGR